MWQPQLPLGPEGPMDFGRFKVGLYGLKGASFIIPNSLIGLIT